MYKWLKQIVGLWQKIEYWIAFLAGVLFFISGLIMLLMMVNKKVEFIIGFVFTAILFLSAAIAFRMVIVIRDVCFNRTLVESLRLELTQAVKVCNDWQEHTEEWKKYANGLRRKYFSDAETVFTITAKHSEILPQQQAIFSTLVNNAVSALAIKSLLEFSNKIDNDTTVLLIRLHHENASWYFEVTGREIELDQALYVVKSVEKKLKDFADKNSLVKNTPKICN